jgi:uncharacterized damage-inducible protein DinB
MPRHSLLLLTLIPLAAFAADPPGAPSKAAAEFAQRWIKTRKLAIGVAEAMPPGEYAFKPDPPSMSFGDQMAHIAWANLAFCHALKDEQAPAAQTSGDKTALVKTLAESFDYCTATINALTDAQLTAVHASPDGRMPGHEILLALYVHLAHHRGQAEVYLRIKGIAPPPYVF